MGDNAFKNCIRLKNVYITNLDAWCRINFFIDEYFNESSPLKWARNFYCNNEPVTNVVVPSGINKIPHYYLSCSSLKSVTIPSSVTIICDKAFCGCTNLEEITIPSSVTELGDGAFGDCTNLERITIPNSIRNIGKNAFGYCESLQNISIPSNLTKIEYGTFLKCTSLRSITIPNNITSIGDCAFSSCKNLNSISIGNGVLSIGASAFCECDSLSSITIPNNVKTLGKYAFGSCANLSYVSLGNSVKSIDKLFYGCKNLKEITIPDSVETIGEQTFWECESLTTIRIGRGVKSIGKYAFEYCPKLTNIPVAESNSAFASVDGNLYSKDQQKLIKYATGKVSQSFNVPENVTTIERDAFRSSVNLTSISLPNSVNNIGAAAFMECINLKDVTLPNGIASIEECAFYNCNNLNSISFSKQVTTIRNGAFLGCSNLHNVYFSGKYTDWSAISISSGNESLTSANIRCDFTIGVDTNCFCHSNDPTYINSGFLNRRNYSLDKMYFLKLVSLSGLSPGEIGLLKFGMNRKWNGSCYGIAMTMANLYNGDINLSDLNDHNANSFFEIGLPWQNPKLDNTIDYYYLSHYTLLGTKKWGTVSQTRRDGLWSITDEIFDSESKFLKKLVECALESKVYVLDYQYYDVDKKADYGHSILITGGEYDYENERFIIKLFDMNSVEKVHLSYNYVTSNFDKGSPTYMFINKDYSDFSVAGVGTEGITRYYSLSIVDPQRFQINSRLKTKQEEPVGSGENESCNFSFSVNQSFELKNEQGQSLLCNGKIVSNEMDLLNLEYIGEDNGLTAVITVKNGKYSLECNGDAVEITMYNDDDFLAFKGEKFDSVNLSFEDGIVMKGNDYSFEASLTTSELLSQTGEKNLVQINGNATSDVIITAGESSVHVDSDENITNANVNNYVSNQLIQSNLETIMPDSEIQNLVSKYGDSNSDGIIDITDVTVIQRYLVEIESMNENQLIMSDLNSDDAIDIADATLLQMYLAGYDVTLG